MQGFKALHTQDLGCALATINTQDKLLKTYAVGFLPKAHRLGKAAGAEGIVRTGCRSTERSFHIDTTSDSSISAATMPKKVSNLMESPAATELLTLSIGLPPPDLVLPDFDGSASTVVLGASVNFVLLVAVVVVLLDGVVEVRLVASVVGPAAELCDKGGRGLDDAALLVVWDSVDEESVRRPVDWTEAGESTIVLRPVEVRLTGTVLMPPAEPCPAVWVMTATLQRTWMPWPSLNRPTIDVSATSTP